MAPSFGRSISFPLSPARSSSSKLKGKHVRSTSLPCRSHPLLAHLQTHIAAVRTWDPSTTPPSAGLAHVAALHSALADPIINGDDAALSDRLLDAFLLLADAHRGFQETLLALKADVADLQAAVRRSDAARLASAARSQRRDNKDLARLAASCIAAVPNKTNKYYCSTEMAVAFMDAAAASATASAAVFSAVASMSKTFAAAFTKKKDTTPPLEELAECIHDCETGSEAVFRTIVRTRVSLLNIRTPAI
jgi:hypothetical protein